MYISAEARLYVDRAADDRGRCRRFGAVELVLDATFIHSTKTTCYRHAGHIAPPWQVQARTDAVRTIAYLFTAHHPLSLHNAHHPLQNLQLYAQYTSSHSRELLISLPREVVVNGADDRSRGVAPGASALELERPASPDELLDDERFADDEFLPYWAELWPSGVALAEHVARRALGRLVVELGCGLGVPSLVAAARGGRRRGHGLGAGGARPARGERGRNRAAARDAAPGLATQPRSSRGAGSTSSSPPTSSTRPATSSRCSTSSARRQRRPARRPRPAPRRRVPRQRTRET